MKLKNNRQYCVIVISRLLFSRITTTYIILYDIVFLSIASNGIPQQLSRYNTKLNCIFLLLLQIIKVLRFRFIFERFLDSPFVFLSKTINSLLCMFQIHWMSFLFTSSNYLSNYQHSCLVSEFQLDFSIQTHRLCSFL